MEKKLRDEIFQDCLYNWERSDGHSEFWITLAQKWGYPTSESLRQEFKHLRRKMGIKKDTVVENPKGNNNPKILILDIETSIRHAFLFRSGEQWVAGDQFEDEPMMLGYSAKYAGDSKVMSDFLTPEEAISKDHSRVVKSLWNLLSTVNITVSYNGNSFDVKNINMFFLKEKLGLPNKIKNIDPCIMARSTFAFDSNKMTDVVKYLGLDDGKHKMERDDWIKCYYGDKQSLLKMEKYCKHDVEILELILDQIKPYVSNLPNMGIYGDVKESQCPSCGGIKFVPNGFAYTSVGKYNCYRCECKTLFRSKDNLLSKDKRKNLMSF